MFHANAFQSNIWWNVEVEQNEINTRLTRKRRILSWNNCNCSSRKEYFFSFSVFFSFLFRIYFVTVFSWQIFLFLYTDTFLLFSGFSVFFFTLMAISLQKFIHSKLKTNSLSFSCIFFGWIAFSQWFFNCHLCGQTEIANW